MKRVATLLMAAILLLSLAACLPKPKTGDSSSDIGSQQSEDSNTQSQQPDLPKPSDSKVAIDGYAYYEDTDNGIRFQYPENWIIMNSNILNKPEAQEVFDDLGMSESQMAQMLESVTAIFYNLEESDESFSANMNYIVMDATVASTAMLTNPTTLAMIKSQLESQYAVLGELDWIMDPQAQQYGGIDTLVYSIEYSYAGMNVRVYEIQFIDGDKHYDFTYSVPVEYADTALDVLGGIVGSFEAA